MSLEGAEDYQRNLNSVHGWFGLQDAGLFSWFLEHQMQSPPGDLLEMGPYLGRSAILLEYFRRADERLVVCDLFGSEAEDDANRDENAGYRNAVRERFEENFLRFHTALPEIIQASTSTLGTVLPAAGTRFVHIDASHIYEHVAHDLRTAKAVLQADGIVACDDFRSPHTPGTAAAVWEAVFKLGLHPICVSNQKLYGTFGDADRWRRALSSAPPVGQRADKQSVYGQDLYRMAFEQRAVFGPLVNKIQFRLPRAVRRRVLKLSLAPWMIRWATEEPLIAAQVSDRTGIDLLLWEATKRR